MSGDPKRLLVDPDTNEMVREDLSRALGAAPPPYDVSRGLSRLLAVTAPPAAVGAGTAAVMRGAKWVYLKWGVGALGIVAATVVSTRVLLPRASSEHRSVNVAIPAPPTATGTEAPPTIVSPSTITTPSASPSASSLRTRHPRSADSTDPASDDRVAREVALLGRARSALSNNPAQALSLADEGQREFPRGILREERESIAVLALVRLGRTREADARGAAFLSRYPNGPFSEKVRLALPERSRP